MRSASKCATVLIVALHDVSADVVTIEAVEASHGKVPEEYVLNMPHTCADFSCAIRKSGAAQVKVCRRQMPLCPRCVAVWDRLIGQNATALSLDLRSSQQAHGSLYQVYSRTPLARSCLSVAVVQDAPRGVLELENVVLPEFVAFV